MKTKQQKEANDRYLKSMEMWLTGQKQVMNGLCIQTENAVKSIDHFKAVKKLCDKQMRHESHYLESTMNDFRGWCESNQVAIPEWAL